MNKFLYRRLLIILFIFGFCHFGPFGYSYVFKWVMSTNEIIRVKSFVRQNVFTNNSFARYVEIMDKASFDVKSVSSDGKKNYYGVDGLFYVFSKDYTKDVEFKLEEVSESKYIQSENGEMIISKDYLMPVVRNVPYFPVSNIDVNQEWFANGKEIQKVGFKELYDVVEIPFSAHYKFIYVTNIDGKDIAVLAVNYGFTQGFKGTKILNYISGSSDILYYWNLTDSKPYCMFENYFFNVVYNDGFSVVYSGTSEGNLEVVKKWEEVEKSTIVSNVSNAISNVKGAEVVVGENEIKLSIPDILFDFGKYNVKEDFAKVLKDVANNLKNYKQVDIVVEGHTDDIGDDDYNKRLSELRAKEVTKFLIDGGIKPERVSYVGYGKSKPKVPNTSEENRAKNRRVEIRIIWGK